MGFLTKIKNNAWNIALSLSSGFAGLLIINANLRNIDKIWLQVPLVLIMGAAAFFLIRFIRVREKITTMNRWILVISSYLSVYSAYIFIHHYTSFFSAKYPDEITTIFFVKIGFFAIAGLWALTVAWQLVFWGVKELYSKLALTRLEKILVVSFVSFFTLLALAVSVFASNNFVLKLGIVDTIYAMDSSALLRDEIYDNNNTGLNTDIRHPFAQTAGTPMGIVSRVVGQLFHFIPYAQEHALQIFTFLMIALSGVLVARLLTVKTKKVNVAIFVAYVCLYSTLIFTLPFEQYVPSVFFMILFVYAVLNGWSYKWTLFPLLVSAGFIITSAAIGVLYLFNKEPIKQRIGKLVGAAVGYLLVVVATGKILTLFHANRQLGNVDKFANGTTLVEKLNQFTNFIATTLTKGYHETFFDGSFWKYRTAALAVEQVNLVGIIILILALIGLYAGRHKVLTWVAGFWATMAFVICVVIGWGSVNNEMALYSFYFGWAYFILVFFGIRWILRLAVKSVEQRRNVIVVLLLVLSLYNLIAFSDILRFTAQHYPQMPVKDLIKETLQYEKTTE